MNCTKISIALSAALALGACASNSPSQSGYDSDKQADMEPASEPAMEPAMASGMESERDADMGSSSMSLHDRVHGALQQKMGSAASGISVRVEGSKVFLDGHVGSQADHDRAHEIAHDVSGVTSVEHGSLKVH